MTAARRSVWVVDDSPTDAAFAKSVLTPHFEVTVFPDGAAALEVLATAAPPDVIVLDWIMPGVSGPDVCRFLRSSEGSKAQVAILLVTAHRATDHVVEGLASGANDYLVKPYAPEELQARVAALVRGKELLERVERAEDTVSRLLSHTPDALLVIDAHGRMTYANPEAERILGASAVALVGRPLAELLPELNLGPMRQSMDRLVTLPDIAIGDEVHSPIARLLSDDFAASATIAFRNVTEHRRTEARRLDFYSIVAHDLRAPLGAVLLRTDFILTGGRGVIAAELTADLRRIEANVRSMVSLINDFLDLARLEGGGYQLSREEIDAVALARAAIDEIRPVVEESRLTIELQTLSPRIPLSADRRRLMQVLMNLLANAIKFTPAGGRIAVSVAAVGGSVEIRVADTGVGIPVDALGTLFQRYRRVESNRAGTGLGLMIVREIVEAHGGEVGVRSAVGEGATFWCRLPSGAVKSSGAQVLIVDDDDDLRETISMLLESQGYTVGTAANGRIALEILRSGEIPAVIICDMLMPEMTGPELMGHLNADARLARIPVLAMSGDLSILPLAPPGALVLQKPIQVDRLLDYVARHVRGVRRAASPS